MIERPGLIRFPRFQTTLAAPVAVNGFGFWSSHDVCVEIRPAEVDTGIIFVRHDLDPCIRIPVDIKNRIEAPRRTNLSYGGATVEMVEHLLATLAGMKIDNCEIWIDQPELPGLDGSSQTWLQALCSVERVEQQTVRPRLDITEITRVGNEEVWVEARPSNTPGFFAKSHIDYGKDNEIGRQTFELEVTPSSFRTELASARTFLLQEEADWLLSQGLGQRVSSADVLIFGNDGLVDNELRFENECVRHKMLDLVGDFALLGCDLVGEIVAHCSGHRLNADLVRVLLTEYQIISERKISA